LERSGKRSGAGEKDKRYGALSGSWKKTNERSAEREVRGKGGKERGGEGKGREGVI